MGLDRRVALFSQGPGPTGEGMSPVDEAKPFDISKREVWEAFKKVKANQGAAGVDRQSIADFEAKLSRGLPSSPVQLHTSFSSDVFVTHDPSRTFAHGMGRQRFLRKRWYSLARPTDAPSTVAPVDKYRPSQAPRCEGANFAQR